MFSNYRTTFGGFYLDAEMTQEVDLDYEVNIDVVKLINNDKKKDGNYIDLIYVEEIGNAIIKKVTNEEIIQLLKEGK